MALSGRDTAALETFSDAACVAPDLVALRDKVDVVGDPTLPETAAEVHVAATGGRAHRLRHDLAGPADPARSRAKLEAKARALLGTERAAALAEATLCADPDIRALGALLRAAPV
jgi:2-methylcitrate dehydratase PrpD